MKAKEIREISDEDLKNEIGRIYKEVADMKFKANAETENSPGKIKSKKKDIARIYTVLNERRGNE